MDISRRTALLGAAAMTAAASRATAAPSALAAADEAAWARIAAHYPVNRAVTQLENGYWGSMASPVIAAHRAILDRLNAETSVYARRGMVRDQEEALARAAEALGVLPEELGMCRAAAEGLSALIHQYRNVEAGDRILYSDTDYDTMQASMASLAASRGAEAVKIAMPRAPTHENTIAAYAEVIEKTPKLKLVLLTHLSHRHGLVLPVAEIVALAKARGIDVIVDCAQSLYHVPFKLTDFGADFVGFNFHKWIGAPLGSAGIWIRKGRAEAIAPSPAAHDLPASSAQARVFQGTVDFSAQLTIPAALDFQKTIPVDAKFARLQYLRDRWVRPLRGLTGLEIMVPDDPRLYGAITSFRIAGQITAAQNAAIVETLFKRFNIMTVQRSGLAAGDCIRVTPSLFTTPAEVDRLVPALRTLAGELARG